MANIKIGSPLAISFVPVHEFGGLTSILHICKENVCFIQNSWHFFSVLWWCSHLCVQVEHLLISLKNIPEASSGVFEKKDNIKLIMILTHTSVWKADYSGQGQCEQHLQSVICRSWEWHSHEQEFLFYYLII